MKKTTKSPVPQLVKDTPLPDTPLTKVSMEYAKAELPAHTFNHSMRVYYYGMVIVAWSILLYTYEYSVSCY